MTRILAVDDSRAIRTIVSKQVLELGLEIDEAEDGEQGLARLEESAYDLVLLDVTMPVLDGPGMLARMREAGNKTPVLMLTSESKRSIVAGVMKLGIEDYILKPWKPEELAAKLKKILRVGGQAAAQAIVPMDVAATPAASADGAAATAGKQFVNILLCDDMENVQKKLRQMLPSQITMSGSVSAQSAIALCRDRVFRVVLIDADIPNVDSGVLAGQLRVLQGHAAFLALTLRTSNNAEKEARDRGFDGVLYKPFNKDDIDDLLQRYFDNQELLTAEDNLLTLGAFTGREEAIERYFTKVRGLVAPAIERVAAACFECAILDVSQMPARPDKTPRLIIDLTSHAQKMGLDVKLVGTPEVGKMLTSFADTAKLPFFGSLQQARD